MWDSSGKEFWTAKNKCRWASWNWSSAFYLPITSQGNRHQQYFAQDHCRMNRCQQVGFLSCSAIFAKFWWDYGLATRNYAPCMLILRWGWCWNTLALLCWHANPLLLLIDNLKIGDLFQKLLIILYIRHWFEKLYSKLAFSEFSNEAIYCQLFKGWYIWENSQPYKAKRWSMLILFV